MRCWARSWGAISFIWWPFHDDLLNIEHSNSFYRFLPDTFIGFPYIWNTTYVDMIYFLRKSIQFAISSFVWCPCTSISPSLQWTQGIGSKRTDNLFAFFSSMRSLDKNLDPTDFPKSTFSFKYNLWWKNYTRILFTISLLPRCNELKITLLF